MRYPARLAHLATRAVVVAKLAPTFAEAHQVDHEEATQRLHTGLSGPLLEDLLAATWTALLAGTKKLDEEGVLEKVAKSLKDRPLRPGRPAKLTPDLSAFLILVDLAAGTASDAAGRVMETDAGKARARAGLVAAGQHLARELTR
jgi:mannose/fructose-specific phosphotransferase system component IIA